LTLHNNNYRHPQVWLPSDPSSLDLLSPTDKIATSSNQQPPTPLHYPSDSAFAVLNSSLASTRNLSSPTIFDLPVTTASTNQSTWLPSPSQTSANRQQHTENHQQSFQPQGDFVLFDQTHRQQPRRQLVPSPLGQTFNTGNTESFYSNSAPSSTVNIRPQQHLSTRPPVPLFNSNSTGNIHQHQQSNVIMNSMSYSPNDTHNMPLTQHPSAYNTSFESLDANFGAGLDSEEFPWDTSATSFTAINTGASSTQTVSPKDIFSDNLGSAPPSTAFTNLTSPDINESPYMADSCETSPLFHDNSGFDGADNWFPLFPETTDVSASMERTVSDRSLDAHTSSSGNSPLILDASNRRKSNQAASPLSGHTRHSSVSGVNKPRRRKGPLPPIEVDPADKTALKRARNTLAARDSRQRKLDHVSLLESRISDLEAREHQFKEVLATYGYNGPLLH
jgi:hypothetical protein